MSDLETEVDVLIVGGGINGCGVARDAAGRGLRVLLCEKDDIASHTSSQSTKLIHGGLRYLENYEFSMVREALLEREVLLGIAPHLIWPVTFVLPHARHLRPAWMIRMGLFLYDHLAKREKLPASNRINLHTHVAGTPLQSSGKIAFTYADCATMDSRLTLLNALDAAERGAQILTHTKCLKADRDGVGWWDVLLESSNGQTWVKAKAVVNAAGPWVSDFTDHALAGTSPFGVRLVQGSHIIVHKLFDHDYAYLFQNADKRIVFAIPYEKDFTLIGTTDVEFQGDPDEVRASSDEIEYLCKLANEYFHQQITPNDVVSTFSGVRPLFDDHSSRASKVTREYVLNLDQGKEGLSAPVLNIFGGKLTAYRQLAEKSINKLLPSLGCDAADWTANEPLPGGDITDGDFDAFLTSLESEYPWMEKSLLHRYARQFGTRIAAVLQGASCIADLGEYFGAGLYEKEVSYLMAKEWATSSEDVLWRRTRQGLWADEATQAALARYMN